MTEKCWRDERNSGRRPVGWKPMACFLCGSLKHLAYECDKKKELMGRLENESEKNKEKVIETDPLVCFTSSLKYKKKDETIDTWVSDSGASHHVCNSLRGLFNIKVCEDRERVLVGKNNEIEVHSFGDFHGEVLDSEGIKREIVLRDVGYIPNFCINLFSLTKVMDLGWRFSVTKTRTSSSKERIWKLSSM